MITGPDSIFWDAWTSPLPEDPGDRDPGIVALVDRINATGWMATAQSCEGHLGGKGSPGPYVWVLVPAADVSRVLDWAWKAERLRRAMSDVFPDDRLVDVSFVGCGTFGYYLCVSGRPVSLEQNAIIVRALEEAL